MKAKPPEFMSADDIAAKLHVSTFTVERWRREGKGPPSFVVGKTIRFRRDAFDAWVKEEEQKHAAQEKEPS